MARLVVDCSVSAGWYLPDEFSDMGQNLLHRIMEDRDSLILPELWWYENLNVLRTAVVRKRITPAGARKALLTLGKVPCQSYPAAKGKGIQMLDTALDNDISAYDAAYVLTAMHNQALLVTADRQLLSLSSSFNCIASLEEMS